MNKKYVALLRGINVGGHKKFPKANQLDMLIAMGFKNPQVYIHTGNWVFESTKSGIDLKILIENTITKKYGWEVPVIVISAKQFKTIFDNCPFDFEVKEQSYFTLLATAPSAERITALKAIQHENEAFKITPNCIYIFYNNGAGKAKLTNNMIEKKLNVSATSRNYKTMLKITTL